MTLRLCIGASIIGTLLLGSQAFAKHRDNTISCRTAHSSDLPSIVHDINRFGDTANTDVAITSRDLESDLTGITNSQDMVMLGVEGLLVASDFDRVNIVRLRDLNCDGIVDSPDVPPFVIALTDIEEYASAYPRCDTRNVDVNGDGAIDGLNVASFTEVLVGIQ